MDTALQKEQIFQNIEEDLRGQGFEILQKDMLRPWGRFFGIDENQAQKFSDTYFSGIAVDQLKISGKLSPKVLLVGPHKRLS
ncbi:MAG: phosphoheptose isomerase, partial [Pedobacter sp.]